MTRICPICDARYDEGVTFCPLDGGELQAPGQNHPGSLIGKTIADRYEVLEQIATGGMGVVYKARQKMLERYVALKVLPRELAANPDTERRFFNEARTISQLRHPHIVTL
ncbi:MAG: protein kinase, partial [Myxococcales bacterium]|nr:protein kinase [Myxococcales bacterium]